MAAVFELASATDVYWGNGSSNWARLTVGVPTVEKTWIRKGPAHADFEALDVLPTLTKKAVAYVGERAKDTKPFFLYLPLASPHTPILPTADWKSKSRLNPYADFVMATDAAVGEQGEGVLAEPVEGRVAAA